MKSPQALILAPKNAFRIASIVLRKSKYERTIASALGAIKIIKENLNKLKLPDLDKVFKFYGKTRLTHYLKKQL
ncbi:MAG: methyltransferase MtaB domain-containing protein [Candidatus Bathyarchaeia archaeon]